MMLIVFLTKYNVVLSTTPIRLPPTRHVGNHYIWCSFWWLVVGWCLWWFFGAILYHPSWWKVDTDAFCWNVVACHTLIEFRISLLEFNEIAIRLSTPQWERGLSQNSISFTYKWTPHSVWQVMTSEAGDLATTSWQFKNTSQCLSP